MFENRKRIIGLSVLFFLLFLSVPANATSFTDNKTVDKYRSWTITFNQEILESSIEEGIEVLDSNDNGVEVDVDLEEDKKIVTVKAPKEGYIEGNDYTLVINTSIKSVKNMMLKEAVELHFNIRNTNQNFTELDKYLNEQMDTQKIPAMSVLIFKNSEILYRKYLGKADVEKDIKLSQDNMFLIASISKVTTATALMQLYDKGLFKLDDPINDYLDFEVKNPNYDKDITFRMLLTHTSSIADGDAMDDQYYYGEDSPVELKYFIKNYLAAGGLYYKDTNYYDFEPGSSFEYSNTGSALIGVLVESISKQDFNEYCKENIFTPLNMANTHWKLSELDINKLVRPYDEDLKPIKHYTFTDYPNGGLRTTSIDLFKLLSCYTNNGVYGEDNENLLSAETVDIMLSQQIKEIDSTVGLHLFKLDNTNNLWGHDGGEQGVSTIMAFNRENGIGVIILTNQGEANLDDVLVEVYKSVTKGDGAI